ncbi:hypothetical protein FH972_022599 [Carpinus fangiana]|uniref:Uncharacterized protein n=1 Tax=Carpinus fangiana TaxID=176857 RepID=A0A5N6KT86_9ROSI|nr:hypothetical protein FH972_022599 [Carpinus fangiana]
MRSLYNVYIICTSIKSSPQTDFAKLYEAAFNPTHSHSTRNMVPSITLIRHAESTSNSTQSSDILDPPLTPHGQSQCETLSKTLASSKSHRRLVVSSPLQRTLQTALLSLPWPRPVIALPDLQELSARPCDTGRSLQVLMAQFGSGEVDFRAMQPDWEKKQGRYRATPQACEERARAAREWLRNADADEVVVVAHGGLLRYLTEDWEGCEEGDEWANAEVRKFEFGAQGSALVETAKSRGQRGLVGARLDRTQQVVLRRSMEARWKAHLVEKGYVVDSEWKSAAL